MAAEPTQKQVYSQSIPSTRSTATKTAGVPAWLTGTGNHKAGGPDAARNSKSAANGQEAKVFRGNNPAKVDDKGRLKIPSAFKTLLDAANVTQLYITSWDGKRAEIWPLPEWEKQEKLLAARSMEDAVDKYLNWTAYFGQQVEIDSQSRVVLPQKLREAARLDAEVVVLGKLVYLEVQNEKDFEERVLGDVMTADDRKSVAALLHANGSNANG
jgi:MraZ protein